MDFCTRLGSGITCILLFLCQTAGKSPAALSNILVCILKHGKRQLTAENSLAEEGCDRNWKENCGFWTFRSGLQQAGKQHHLKAKRIKNPICHPISRFLQLWMGWEAATVNIFVSETLRTVSCEYSDEFLLPWISALLGLTQTCSGKDKMIIMLISPKEDDWHRCLP